MAIYETLYRISSLAQNRQLQNFGFDTNLQGWIDAHRVQLVENWWYYHGYHNIFLQRFEKEDEHEYLQRIQYATIENHIKPIVNLMVSYLYGDGDSVKRYVTKDGNANTEIQDLLQRVVWNCNNIPELDDAKALNASITGYTVIQRELLDIRTDKPFPLGTGNIEKNKYGYIKKTPLDSCFTYLLPYVDKDGVIDARKVGAILYFSDHSTNPANINPVQLLNNAFTDYKVMWYIDDTVWEKWVQDPLTKKWNKIDVNPGGANLNVNPYGNVLIPFSVYKNVGDPYYIEGDSDVFDMRSLNLELNELANGDKEVIRYHQYPILAAFGCELPTEWVRTKNTTFTFPDVSKDKGNLSYITWDGNIQASQVRQEQIRRSLSQVSQISLLSRGYLKDIGQIRSGPPLKALFSSDRALMNRKFAIFKANESADMRADVLFWKQNVDATIDIDNTYQFNCQFEKDFLGIDALLEAEIAAIQKQSGIQTIEEILETEHPDWTPEQINKAKQDIEQSQQVQGQGRGATVQSPDLKGIQQNG